MSECLTLDGVFGNPSSHASTTAGAARARVEQARAQVAALIGAPPQQIVCTSGATESNNLAILGTRARRQRGRMRGRHLVTAAHRAQVGARSVPPPRARGLPGHLPGRPIASGLIAPQRLREALRADTVLVSIMHANNEIGVLQDIEAISGRLSRARRAAARRCGTERRQGGARCRAPAVRSAVLHRAQALWPQGHRCAVRRAGTRAPAAAADVRRRPGARPALRHAGGAPDRRLWRGLRAGRGATWRAERRACERLRARLWQGLARDRRGAAQRPCHAARARHPERVLRRASRARAC